LAFVLTWYPDNGSADEARLSGQELLRQSRERLLTASSISASIRHQTNMFGQQLVGSGSYRQLNSPDGLKVRLELAIRTEERSTSHHHISDGRFLWVLENDGAGPRAYRIDLRQVRESARPTDAGRVGTESISIEGLPGLLSSIDRNFQFRVPQLVRFHEESMWAIAGLWRPERLKSFFPDGASDRGIAASDLPGHVPDRVFLLIGQEDLFPYRIEFRRGAAASTGTTSASSVAPLLIMDFYRVNLGGTVDEREFTYSPGDVHIEDRTDHYIGRLTN
jgi:hypothetical protein